MFICSLSIRQKQKFVVETVKSLSDKYWISYILQSVAEIKNKDNMSIGLRIVGKGPQEQVYKQFVTELGIDNITH